MLTGLSVGRVGGVLVLVKAGDVALRGPVGLPAPLWAVVLGLFVGGGAVLVAGQGWARGGWSSVLVGAAGLAVDLPLELRRQHLVLLMGVALIGLVTRSLDERLLLWRVQLSALYGVAALSKLNESFLGGDVLAGAVVAAPAWSSVLDPPPPQLLVLAGLALIATEVALAVAPWVARLRRPGTALAVAFHSATLVLVSNDPLVGLRLVVFGGTAVLLHAASARVLAD